MVREFLVHQCAGKGDDDPEAQRIAALDELYAEIDAEQEPAESRSEPVAPMTREEVYAERLR